jgi:hypothetical protein
MTNSKPWLGSLAIIYTVVLILGISIQSFDLYSKSQYEQNRNAGTLGATETRNGASIAAEEEKPLEPIKPVNFELTASWFGDVFWGRRMNRWSQDSPEKYSFPFSGLNTFEKAPHEHWIANLECPTTTEQLTTYQEETLLKFNCPTEYLPEARKYFDIFSLANNHTSNLEESNGLARTRQNLDQYGFQYFGSFDNARQNEICEVVSLKLKTDFEPLNQDYIQAIADQKIQDPRLQDYYLPIALCGYHNVFKLPTQNELDEISKYSEHFITIVLPHQGAEYGASSDSLQKQYYRQMIDLGADMVLGGHTHSVHETESYNGKLIVYSMGNFIFDQQFGVEVTRSIGLKTLFEFANTDQVLELQEFSQECLQFQDSCLQIAGEKNIAKVDFDLNLELITSQNDGRVTRKASPEVTQALLQRTRWESTVGGLGY